MQGLYSAKLSQVIKGAATKFNECIPVTPRGLLSPIMQGFSVNFLDILLRDWSRITAE
jgi:hypothetical protein